MTYSLGRIVNHDPRNRLHTVETPCTTRDVQWERLGPIIDQGDLGCCTGAAMAGWLSCRPHIKDQAEANIFCSLDFVYGLYGMATRLDSFPGTWPPDDTGSSGLSVAKAAKQMNLIREYRWAFSADSLVKALQLGPIIAGVPWYEGMFNPDRNGRLWPYGEIAGGHEILIRGLIGRDLIVSNSWGTGWGLKGEALLPLDVWAILRRQQADVTVPICYQTK